MFKSSPINNERVRKNMNEFKGKAAVITGAGRGIAWRCAQEGMKVVLAGIGLESLTKTEADLQAMGAEALIVQTDVSLLDQVENLAEKSYEKFAALMCGFHYSLN